MRFSETLSNYEQLDSIYLDFSKAFDTVSHNKLLMKLKSVGICGILLKWLSSYLKGSTQIVNVKGYLSEKIDVTSGVSQGSHCGPILFNIFINDIKHVIEFSQFLFYADDIKVFMRIKSVLDATKLQKDLEKITQWAS